MTKAETRPDETDLARLLEAEARFEARLQAARVECEKRVAAAQAEQLRAREAGEIRVEAAIAEARERVLEQRRRDAERIEADAKQEVARLDGVLDVRVDELARWIVDRALGGDVS